VVIVQVLPTGATEEYNGSAWTAGGSLATARLGLAGCGIQTAALAVGATPTAEEYNGTSWTAGGVLNTPRTQIGTAGIQTAALAFGGTPFPSVSAVTEEYDGSTWTNSCFNGNS
jgi:hypothetical protein